MMGDVHLNGGMKGLSRVEIRSKFDETVGSL